MASNCWERLFRWPRPGLEWSHVQHLFRGVTRSRRHFAGVSEPRWRGAAFLLLVGFCFAATPAQAVLGRIRPEFIRAIRRVSDSLQAPRGSDDAVGMDAREVLSILGRPDDVVVEEDGIPVVDALPPGVLLPQPMAVPPGKAGDQLERRIWWAYGTAGHRGFATLGRVGFNERGQVVRVYGSYPGPPIGRRVLPESRLRELLRLLAALPDPIYNWSSYNPLPVIRAVNALQPLGKDTALAVVGEYIRVTVVSRHAAEYSHGEEADRLLLIMNTLFGAPDAVNFDPHAMTTQLHRDVPLYWPVGGGGNPPHFSFNELEYYRKQGVMRAQLLCPPARPLGILDSLTIPGSPTDLRASEWIRTGAMNELLRLIEPVYHIEPDRDGYRIAPGEDLDARWRRIREEVDRLPYRWDSRRQTYILTRRTSR